MEADIENGHSDGDDDMPVDIPPERSTPQPVQKYTVYYESLTGTVLTQLNDIGVTVGWNPPPNYAEYKKDSMCIGTPHAHLELIRLDVTKDVGELQLDLNILTRLKSSKCHKIAFLVICESPMLASAANVNWRIFKLLHEMMSTTDYKPAVRVFYYSTLVKNSMTLQILQRWLQ